jgi:ABC-type nitrate/sulfonate/bicarbonate transport system permease component
MNFSRMPKWVWWVGGAVLILAAWQLLTAQVSVDLPPLIPPPPK